MRKVRWISPLLLLAMLALVFAPGYVARAADEAENSAGLNEDDVKTLAVGTIDEDTFEFEPAFQVGNTTIVVVEKDPENPRRLVYKPIKKGTTSVQVRDPKGKLVRRVIFNVIATDISPKVLAIRRLLQDIEGIRIELVDEKIVIDGELVVPRDLDRIVQIQSAYPEVLNLVSLSRISREAIARRMQKEINDDPGGVNVMVKIINDTFFLLGKVDNDDDRSRAEMIAMTYIPDIMKSAASDQLSQGAKRFSIRNLILKEEPPPPPPPKMVRITYHFVEIGKDFLKSSYFKWTPFLTESSGIQIGQSTTGGTAASGTFSGFVSNLLPKLASGANGGFSRVLLSSVSIGEENQTQEVVRTDSVPFVSAVVNGVPVSEIATATINSKTKPAIINADTGLMRLECLLQFEAIVGQGAGGRPRKNTTSMTNSIIVKSGDSAALGGLITSDTAKDLDRDPEQANQQQQGMALFTLLRSKNFRNKKTQFVVFVTPKLIEDAGSGTADIKAKILNNSQKKRRRVVN